MKTKKIWLSIGIVPILATPLIGVVACNKTTIVEQVTVDLEKAREWIKSNENINVSVPSTGTKTISHLDQIVSETSGASSKVFDEQEMRDELGITGLTLREKPAGIQLFYKLRHSTVTTSKGQFKQYSLLIVGTNADNNETITKTIEPKILSSDKVGQSEIENYLNNTLRISTPSTGQVVSTNIDNFINMYKIGVVVEDQAEATMLRDTLGLSDFFLGEIPNGYEVLFLVEHKLSVAKNVKQYNVTVKVTEGSTGLSASKTLTLLSADVPPLTDEEIVTEIKNHIGMPVQIRQRTIAQLSSIQDGPFNQNATGYMGISQNFPPTFKGALLNFTIRRNSHNVVGTKAQFEVVVSITKGQAIAKIEFLLYSSDDIVQSDDSIVQEVKTEMGLPTNLETRTIAQLRSIQAGVFNANAIAAMGITWVMPEDMRGVTLSFAMLPSLLEHNQKAVYTVIVTLRLNGASGEIRFELTSTDIYEDDIMNDIIEEKARFDSMFPSDYVEPNMLDIPTEGRQIHMGYVTSKDYFAPEDMNVTYEVEYTDDPDTISLTVVFSKLGSSLESKINVFYELRNAYREVNAEMGRINDLGLDDNNPAVNTVANASTTLPSQLTGFTDFNQFTSSITGNWDKFDYTFKITRRSDYYGEITIEITIIKKGFPTSDHTAYVRLDGFKKTGI